jgi:ADP-ribose pyrophosphatase YjhB (NUDIX family)
MLVENNQIELAIENNLSSFNLLVLEPSRTICEKIMSLVRFSYSENPISDALSALDWAYNTGRARYVGISNFSGWQTSHCVTRQTNQGGKAPIASIQSEYSLLNREVEREIIPAAQALGFGFLPWSPLGRGVLTGKYRNGLPSDSRGASAHFAGFVEPGESFEHCVIREVREEAGVELTKINYLGSQPWPFPASLMIAFEAVTNTPELARADGDEIEEIRWFSRADMKAAIADKSLILPLEISVARQMINAWYGEGAEKDLVGAESWR